MLNNALTVRKFSVFIKNVSLHPPGFNTDSAKAGSGSKRMPEFGPGSEILAFTEKLRRIDI